MSTRRYLALTVCLIAAASASVAIGATCPTMNANNIVISYSGARTACANGHGICSPGETISFSVTSVIYDFSCAAHTFVWTFGDGTTGSGQNLTHIYSTGGSYAVVVTISNPSQSNFQLTQNVPVDSRTPTPTPTPTPISPTPSPTPSSCATIVPGVNVFIAYHGAVSTCTQFAGICRAGEAIAMSATPFGYDFGCATHIFTWNFGDGTTGSGQNVTHTYAAAATYPVMLTISNISQTATMVQTVPVSISPGPPPPACGNITVSPANLPLASMGVAYSQTLTPSGGAPPYSIFIVAGSLPSGLNLELNKVSGTPTAGGSFSFTLHVVDSNGCGAVVPYTIVVSSACPMMVPNGNVLLDYNGRSSCSDLSPTCIANEPINFAAAALGYNFGCAVHVFAWNFGDGQFAAGESVTHAFAQPGVYTVTLTIANPQQSVQLTKVVTIKAVRRRAVPR